MRPIKITMSAFGPYKKEEKVEMFRLGKKGLYLITGDTGAGKTTLFDAITFALYGEASGNTRDGNMMRSKYAEPSVKTYVEMDFEYGGKLYRIRRNPSYQRPKERGAGSTTEPADATLWFLNDSGNIERIVHRNTEVKKCIEEIMGINCDQFRQIAMIAQGDFREVLTADTRKRREIYSKIFRTEKYSKIQNKLLERKSALENDCRTKVQLIRNDVEALSADENDALKNDLAAAKSSGLTKDIIRIAKNIVSNDKELLEELYIRDKTLEDEIGEKKLLIQKAKDVEQLKQKLEDNCRITEEKKSQEQSAKESLAAEEQHADEIEELKRKIHISKENLKDYDELEKCRHDLTLWESSLSENRDKLTSKENQKVIVSEQLRKFSEEAFSLKDIDANTVIEENEVSRIREEKNKTDDIYRHFTQYQSALKKLRDIQQSFIKSQKNAIESHRDALRLSFEYSERKKSELLNIKEKSEETDRILSRYNEELSSLQGIELREKELSSLIDNLVAEHKKVSALKKEVDVLQETLTDYNNAKRKYREKCIKADELELLAKSKERAYYDEQAGILAEELEDGIPCPVCGSVHHPSPARKSEKAPSKEELEKVKTSFKNASKDLQKQHEKVISLKSDYTNRKQRIDLTGKEIFGDSYSFQVLDSLIEGKLSDISDKGGKAKEERSAVRDNISRKKSFEDKIHKLDNARIEMQKRIETLIAEANKCETNAKNYEDSFRKYIKDCQTRCIQAGIEDSLMFSEEYTPVNVSGLSSFPSEQELIVSGNRAEERSATAASISRKAAEQRNTVQELRSIIDNKCRESFGDGYSADSAGDLIIRRQEYLNKRLTEAESKLSDILIKKSRKASLESEINKLTKVLEDIGAETETLGKHIFEFELKKQKSVDDYEKFRTKLEFETKEEAINNIAGYEEEKSRFENRIRLAKEKYDRLHDEIIALSAQKKELEKSIKEFDIETNVSSETDKLDELKEAKENLRERIDKVKLRNSNNQSALKNISRVFTELEDKEKTLSMVKALHDTAAGKIKEKEKIQIETYVQMHYFDRIINHANKRLYVMSKNQYELVRRSKSESNSGQSGLDLDIKDYYNNTVRSANSLSGGESFMASLSLALGLSDEIMTASGGIQLDTMFVDEGFGSLDGESLEAALEALNVLTEGNRLVGIISHVEQLKNRIDKQIIVKKDRVNGSKTEIVC